MMDEWIKIADAESIPLGVPLWLYDITRHRVYLAIDTLTLAIEPRFYSHYMHVQAPLPPEEEG